MIHGSLKKFYKDINKWYINDLNLYFDIISTLSGFIKFKLTLKVILQYYIYFYRKVKVSDETREIKLLCGLIHFKYTK